ncbi:hypothetical protein NXV57_27440 [Bacteroides thetaiotaomicron]|nr:hypothetical protein [Bacteroides thetaiotaomicron]
MKTSQKPLNQPTMEPNKLIKDKNKLLMAIPVILGILFLYVFFIREDGNVPSGSDRQAASQAFLEPQSEMADKVNDKMEAYKQDKLEEQEKARILKESQVKGSDFYFESKTSRSGMTVPHWSASAVCRTIRTAKSWQNTEVAGTDASLIAWKANWTDWRTSRRSTRLSGKPRRTHASARNWKNPTNTASACMNGLSIMTKREKRRKPLPTLPAIHPPTA